MGMETPPINAVYFGDINEKFLEALWRGPERLVMSSEGGCIHCMLAGIDYLAMNPTTIMVTGHCWSAAVPVLACAAERFCTPNISFLIHPSSVTVNEEPIREVTSYGKQVELFDKKYTGLLAKHTKKPFKFWKELADACTYFTANEAKRWGLIDKIIRT